MLLLQINVAKSERKGRLCQKNRRRQVVIRKRK
jgi:hypothetical protein